MHEVEQPPENGRQVVSDVTWASDAATAAPADVKDASPEREIVLSPELVAQIGRPNEAVPPYLRLGRALVGFVLLALAWGCVVLVLLLANAVLSGLNEPLHVTLHLLLSLLGALAMIWLVVVALACLVAGAFSFSLALSHRDW
ncbi:MAG TPA: hypothetical protein VGP82_21880 [Ktedonobacterales bacterium]|jgi:hypothetical protein|nr:hypothetical protein [Ktedonobacterales bacterium]